MKGKRDKRNENKAKKNQTKGNKNERSTWEKIGGRKGEGSYTFPKSRRKMKKKKGNK